MSSVASNATTAPRDRTDVQRRCRGEHDTDERPRCRASENAGEDMDPEHRGAHASNAPEQQLVRGVGPVIGPGEVRAGDEERSTVERTQRVPMTACTTFTGGGWRCARPHPEGTGQVSELLDRERPAEHRAGADRRRKVVARLADEVSSLRTERRTEAPSAPAPVWNATIRYTTAVMINVTAAAGSMRRKDERRSAKRTWPVVDMSRSSSCVTR
jgi:hypothetical protein